MRNKINPLFQSDSTLSFKTAINNVFEQNQPIDLNNLITFAQLSDDLDFDAQDQQGRTLLMAVAKFGDKRTLQRTLALNVNSKIRDKNGNAAIDYAITNPDFSLFNELIEVETPSARVNKASCCFHIFSRGR